MEDKATAEAKQRIDEAAAKAVAQEKARSAPKMVMMKLISHNDWVSWFHQAKELVSGITSEISKVQLIYNSLSNQEDRKHLAGITSFNEIMKYLRQKYHKTAEVASCILAGTWSSPCTSWW